jgi:hypothetical protein
MLVRSWLVAATASAVVGVAATAAPAGASVRTFTLRSGPVGMGDFNTALPKRWVRTPRVDGFIVRMHARLVDARGRPVTIRDVMLHHVTFRRQWRPARRHDCTSGGGEAFYGTGEEDQSLRLPAGYGYRLRRHDRWRMTAMLMSHSTRSVGVYVEYRVTVDTNRRLTPVRAFWVRANGCASANVSYPVVGGGPPGSTVQKAYDWRVPFSGRIVAAGGHLHGGARDMWLSQPRCGDRRLFDTRPLYGMPEDLMYRVRPLLHEPGPMDTRYFESRTGIAVRAGETLRLTGAYDGERPHGGVMSIMHVYIAAGAAGPRACRPLPADVRQIRKPGRFRAEPPQVTVPLSGIDARGRTYTITDPGPVRPLAPDAVVDVGDAGFSVPHAAIPAGGRITWRFVDPGPHNVRLANGPRLVGTPTLRRGASFPARFDVAGRYELFCSLHPVTMHEVVDVLPGAGATAATSRADPRTVGGVRERARRSP